MEHAEGEISRSVGRKRLDLPLPTSFEILLIEDRRAPVPVEGEEEVVEQLLHWVSVAVEVAEEEEEPNRHSLEQQR